jgi:hypothetical protein
MFSGGARSNIAAGFTGNEKDGDDDGSPTAVAFG